MLIDKVKWEDVAPKISKTWKEIITTYNKADWMIHH